MPQPPIPSWDPHDGALTDDLVGYYNFDSDFMDYSGKANHGDPFGSPTIVADGAIGKALSLDGVEDFIQLPISLDFDFGVSDFTLTFWYRVSGDQSGSPAIIGNKDWSSGLNPGWVVLSSYGPGSNGDDLAINLSDGISRADTSKAVDVDFNSWHFVAIRVKRGDRMSIVRSVAGSYIIQEDMVPVSLGSLSTGKIIFGSFDACHCANIDGFIY